MLPLQEFRNLDIDHLQRQREQELDKSRGAVIDLACVAMEDEHDQHERAYSIAVSASIAANKHISDFQHTSTETAMDLYTSAMRMEGQGALSEALVYYRRAFKLDPDIDRRYRRCGSVTDEAEQPTYRERRAVECSGARASFAGNRACVSTSNTVSPHTPSINALSSVEQGTGHKTAIVAFDALPHEILVRILCHLVVHSVSSVLTCSLVNKHFFHAARSPTLWRFACDHVFNAPGMISDKSPVAQAAMVKNLYGNSWMRMFVERPRIRYDGVYVSVCQYIRSGESDTAWTAPVYLVTYYRYLRFFRNGSVIKYVSTEKPSQVVKLFSANFSKRQVFHGQFQMDGEHLSVDLWDLSHPKYTFNMALVVKSTHQCRNNKLILQRYKSRKGEGDETLYDLKVIKPFLFSAVPSFAAQ